MLRCAAAGDRGRDNEIRRSSGDQVIHAPGRWVTSASVAAHVACRDPQHPWLLIRGFADARCRIGL